jgi:sulfite exporter TauE/SafE
MSLWAVLVTGLFAGGASCAAVQGGLLAGAVARQRKTEVEVAASAGRSKRKSRRQPEPPPPRLADDAVPVAGFLVGKLASHILLGALLGTLGDAVQIGFRARATMQIVAGVVMIALAADLLGFQPIRRVMPRPPAAWGRTVRRSARWGGGMAPAMLGFATILIPCGITLSM